MKLLLIDNYDSFTYNLVHLLRSLGVQEIEVHRNDQIELDAISDFGRIVISPGPGIPSEAGIVPEMIKRYGATHSIFGVCLGHQSIAEAYGGRLFNMGVPRHGVESVITVVDPEERMFRGLPQKFTTGRYHSWLVDKSDLPAVLTVTATDDEGAIMALRHREFDVRGVQFHPESVMTEHGAEMVKNWLGM